MKRHDTKIPTASAQFEFAILPADFDTVRPLVQLLYRRARGQLERSDQMKFSWKQKFVLWRHKFHQIKFIGEKDMRIIEPVAQSDITVLSISGNSAFLRCLSAMLPSIEVVEVAELNDGPKHQMHGLYVRKAGRIVRRAEASIGIHSVNWEWQEDGRPMLWEDTKTYTHTHISKRQSRATLTAHMRQLGFDAERYLEDGTASRLARFRNE
ncbi:MAG: hypothetical protein AAFQ66_16025 [Pseudomonadota bacterium]